MADSCCRFAFDSMRAAMNHCVCGVSPTCRSDIVVGGRARMAVAAAIVRQLEDCAGLAVPAPAFSTGAAQGARDSGKNSAGPNPI